MKASERIAQIRARLDAVWYATNAYAQCDAVTAVQEHAEHDLEVALDYIAKLEDVTSVARELVVDQPINSSERELIAALRVLDEEAT